MTKNATRASRSGLRAHGASADYDYGTTVDAAVAMAFDERDPNEGRPGAGRTDPVRALQYRELPKRLLDVTVVLLAAPFILPIVAALVLLIALDGGHPFYCQDRVGRHGRHFRIWKLRSMCLDSDEVLQTYLAYNPQAGEEWTVTQKLRSDPRVTRIGRILRKSSLDELPQLWNVLIGDMSLVGPRPMLPEQRSLYPGKKYYSLLPGITGLWQVSERNDSAFADRAKFDDVYDREISFKLDLKLLLATVKVVYRGTGH